MGAYSPVPVAGDDLVEEVMDRFVMPTLVALQKDGIDYRGVLYAGLMLTPDGPKLLEYNCRFGDPEAQVVLPRLAPGCDLAELLHQAAEGSLRTEPAFAATAAVCVVVASPGYPADPRVGAIIDGLGNGGPVAGGGDVTVYCAGVSRDGEGRLITAGGRVLDVVGMGPSIGQARSQAYQGVRRVRFVGMHYRNDIAARAARQEASA
jgi:phosphoribosylamine--glycine ligase